MLDAALAQIPRSSRAKILVRVDGAGATHGLLKRLQALNTTRRMVRYTVGWTITPEDERAIACLPEAAWETSLRQDGEVQEGYFVVELTGLNTREGWSKGMRLIVRGVKHSRRHLGKLTAFEQKTGWRHSITATNIRHMGHIAGTHQVQFLNVLHRDHAGVEDRVRTNKAMGLANLPPKSWETNASWMLTANLAADLDAWLRLRPSTTKKTSSTPSRTRWLPPLPPAHRTDLALGDGVRKQLEAGQQPDRRHLTASLHLNAHPEEEGQHPPGPWNPAHPAATRDGPPSHGEGTLRANRRATQGVLAGASLLPQFVQEPGDGLGGASADVTQI
ncbi:transposase [Streptomyces griseiscabiei]|uniref:Transposase n=1 Tax=Streptomyces griseiscabiei TaxID=2993540 RepID=A0ABU4LHT1_9ACTN|nr:transposase [Streptomyces griseiscabiei]MDX2915168.1 transposase [Streptomyces griseiscabiei]